MTAFNVNNRDLNCYLVNKHSWKGKYKRIFSIGTLAITTYNPQSLEITNQWSYSDFLGVNYDSRATQNRPNDNEIYFVINFKKKSKNENMKFSSEYAHDILTSLFENEAKFAGRHVERMRYNSFKEGWNERRVSVILEVGATTFFQLNQQATVVAKYHYKDIKEITRVTDCPGGFVIAVGEKHRRHMFVSQSADKIITEIRQNAGENLGIFIQMSKESLTLDDFRLTRLGLNNKDELLTSYVEFEVQKHTLRSENPIRRLMCLSEKCLIERDKQSYVAICARALTSIVCLSRDLKDPQKFCIEYENGEQREYSSNTRDLILASLIDGSRASSNYQIFVMSRHFEKNLRILPFKFLLDEDGELQIMKHIINVPPGLRRHEMIRRFNANIPYNGLTYSTPNEGFFTENKGRIIVGCLESVIAESYPRDEPDAVYKTEAQLACLHRLFASKAGFQAFTAVPGVREKLGSLVVNVLKWNHEAVDHATVEMLCSLMQPMHSQYELRLEQLNKKSLLASKEFVEHLLNLVVTHVERGTGSLVIASMLDFLTYTVCYPYGETTHGDVFDMVLECVAERGRSFYKLFLSPSMTIIKGAGLVMRAIIEESSPEVSKAMQVLSLTEGAFLTHLQLALLSTGKDLRVLANKQLSGHLIALWISENSAAMELLKRCIPRGLLAYFESTEKVPTNEADYLLVRNNLEVATNETKQSALEQQLRSVQISVEARLESILHHWNLEQKLTFLNKSKEVNKNEKPVVLRRSRKRVKSTTNWKLFSYYFSKDHAKADLIWNEKTREEFRQAIENEHRTLQQEMQFVAKGTLVSWNHAEFFIEYPSLAEETKIGDYYLRFLLTENNAEATPIHDPTHFFNTVYHRYLLTPKLYMKCLCLKAMGIAYERHAITIGDFTDSKYIVSMLEKCTTIAERDHLIFLISKLVLDKNNVRELIAAGVVPLLVDLGILAHLHVSRPTLPMATTSIEFQGKEHSQNPEWFYHDEKGERKGKLSFHEMKDLFRERKITEKTEIWAEGYDKWYPLGSVSQFKWTVCQEDKEPQSSSTPAAPTLYSLTELCVVILDTLIQMCSFFPSRDEAGAVIRPLPKIKKVLSEPVILYQIVPLLLTYDSQIVQRVAALLLAVMEDNQYISRLYLSGVYFFVLMYNGSNILTIARFLHYTHLKQAFRSNMRNFKSDLVASSILCHILPEATIFYLEQYGPEKYAEVFLGEFENPEIIWNTEMRRNMMEKLSLHVSEFSSRLTSNVRALYCYTPIPPIEYPQLEEELFCHYYYLRHLCDDHKFPNWPIREPEIFLRLCLEIWYEEMDKKPASMSVEEACAQLEIPMNGESWMDRAVVKKAYAKLSLLYHPDKNKSPEASEMFVKINNAYLFLTSKLVQKENTGQPDLQRIIICLRTQSIIYSRYYEELSELKYAGYTSLIKTIDLESQDDKLFKSGDGELLIAAVELCSWTLKSSALNAEQLRRESGLEALYRTFERCYNFVSLSSKETDMVVKVCTHVCNCFAIAAQFEPSREKISEMRVIFQYICHLLKFDHLHRLAVAAAECVCSFSVCTLLQTQLFQAGVIWHLLPHLFRYDFTLDEGGVSHSEDSNQQSILNKLARSSAEALACLAGFRENHPENDGVQRSLQAMLTPYVCKLMRAGNNNEVLKVLNNNSETPYIIWNNGTRAELLDFVEKHKQSGSDSQMFGAEFQLSAYAKELIVGDIFVRIYNLQPDFKLDEPKKVCLDLLDFLRDKAEAITGFATAESKKPTLPAKPKPPPRDDLIVDLSDMDWVEVPKTSGNHFSPVEQGENVLDALTNVLLHNSGIEIILLGQFPLIFQFLRSHQHPSIQVKTLNIISIAASNKECVSDIAASFQLGSMLVLIPRLPKSINTIFRTLIALSSNGTIVKALLEYGGLVYVLNVFCDSQAPSEHRLLAAELFAKLQSDKLTGPRWKRFINRYLPPIFADALRDNPTSAIQMFDSTTESPELIWNEDIRKAIKQNLSNGVSELSTNHLRDPGAKWSAPSPEEILYQSVVDGEIIVGGVYIRLFNANPGWTVRNPKEFTTELMEKILELMKAPNNQLEPVTTALCSLIQFNKTIADQISTQGYLNQFCSAMASSNPRASRTALLILNELATNEYCAESLVSEQVIKGLYNCMKQQPSLIGEAAHALKYLTKKTTPELAQQFLSTGIIPYMLELLGSSLAGVGNPNAAKAEMVDALKQVSRDLTYGDKITEILDKSPIWAQYKDQRHDLFLPASRTQAITGGPTNHAAIGYLTNSMFQPPPSSNEPPPRD